MIKHKRHHSFLAFLLAFCMVIGSIPSVPVFAEEEGGENEEPVVSECELNGHDYEVSDWTWSSDESTCVASLVCKRDASHTDEKAAAVSKKVELVPTCEEAGKEKLTASIELNGETKKTVITREINPTGHDYRFSAWEWSEDLSKACVKMVCSHNSEHVTEIAASVEKHSVPATCTEPAVSDYTASALVNDEMLTDTKHTVDAAPLGHDYQAKDFIWSKDHTEATAIIVCANDETDVHEAEAEVTVTDTTTCTEDGQIIYTAVASFAGKTFTDKNIFKSAAYGHSFGEPAFAWAEDLESATASFTCAVCGEMVALDCEVTKDVVEEAPGHHGKITYTASIVFEESNYEAVIVDEDNDHEAHAVTNRVPLKEGGFDDVTSCEICGLELDRVHVTYTIVYDANEGKGQMADQIVSLGIPEILNENEFTRTGYLFEGWIALHLSDETVLAMDEEGNCDWFTQDEIIANGYAVVCIEDGGMISDLTDMAGDVIVLYAYWEPISYTVSYDKNGGKGSMEDSMITYGVSTALSANSFTKSGYHFAGWTVSRASDGKWYAKDENGKKGWYTEAQIEAYEISKVVYKDKTKVSKTTTVNGDTVTMHAVWKGNSYKLSFSANGGKGSMSSQTMTYGTSKAIKKNAYTKTGYSFKGWYAHRSSDDKWYAKNAEGKKSWYTEEEIKDKGLKKVLISDGASYKSLSKVEGDIVKLSAQWKANTFTVSFDADGGKGTMKPMTYTYGKSQAMNANKFSRSGYKFGGWYAYRASSKKWYAKKADGTKGWYSSSVISKNGYTKVVLKDKSSVSKITPIDKDEITMKAIWKK